MDRARREKRKKKLGSYWRVGESVDPSGQARKSKGLAMLNQFERLVNSTASKKVIEQMK